MLADPTIFTAPPTDLSRVPVIDGDYDPAALARVLDSKALAGDVVRSWRRHARGQTTIVFAATVQASQAIVQAFAAHGIRAEHLDGNTPASERRRILDDLHAGRLTIVSNVDVLTEGFDCPRAAVAVLARPTHSLAVYMQQVGRIMRPYPGKVATVLDHAGNVLAHGHPLEDREWSLAGLRKRDTADVLSLTTCDGCLACYPTGAPCCPVCGSEGEPSERAARFTAWNRALDLREFDRSGPGPGLPAADRAWMRALWRRDPTDEDLQASYDAIAARWQDSQGKAFRAGWKVAAVALKFKALWGGVPGPGIKAACPIAASLQRAAVKEMAEKRRKPA